MVTNYPVIAPPRSGSSMLMHCLDVGGMPVLFSRSRERFNGMQPGNFKLNPHWLYEIERDDVKAGGFPDGYALKILRLWLPDLPIVPGTQYHAAVIKRHPEELSQANEAAFGIVNPAAWWEERYRTLYEELAARPDIASVTTVVYHDIMADSVRGLAPLAAWPVDLVRAATVPDVQHYTLRAAFPGHPDPRLAVNLVEGL